MKMLRSRKALSPVVASIILIAVTVAVSIAVAAWMGALTFNFMATEQLKITNVSFPSAGNVAITIANTGTTPITITEIHVNNGATNLFSTATPTWTGNVSSNAGLTETVAFDWADGAQYEVEMRSAKGNQFTYMATAPSY
jgi:flagellin-like protein